MAKPSRLVNDTPHAPSFVVNVAPRNYFVFESGFWMRVTEFANKGAVRKTVYSRVRSHIVRVEPEDPADSLTAGGAFNQCNESWQSDTEKKLAP